MGNLAGKYFLRNYGLGAALGLHRTVGCNADQPQNNIVQADRIKIDIESNYGTGFLTFLTGRSTFVEHDMRKKV